VCLYAEKGWPVAGDANFNSQGQHGGVTVGPSFPPLALRLWLCPSRLPSPLAALPNLVGGEVASVMPMDVIIAGQRASGRAESGRVDPVIDAPCPPAGKLSPARTPGWSPEIGHSTLCLGAGKGPTGSRLGLTSRPGNQLDARQHRVCAMAKSKPERWIETGAGSKAGSRPSEVARSVKTVHAKGLDPPAQAVHDQLHHAWFSPMSKLLPQPLKLRCCPSSIYPARGLRPGGCPDRASSGSVWKVSLSALWL
jgi:hypothetical protein